MGRDRVANGEGMGAGSIRGGGWESGVDGQVTWLWVPVTQPLSFKPNEGLTDIPASEENKVNLHRPLTRCTMQETNNPA